MEQRLYFKNLTVYQLSKKFVSSIYPLLKKFPQEERYALCDQIRRASISVPSNVVEGMSRNSDKEKVNFLNIAYGSLMEVLCQLDIAFDLHYITEEELKAIETTGLEISRIIKGMMRNRS